MVKARSAPLPNRALWSLGRRGSHMGTVVMVPARHSPPATVAPAKNPPRNRKNMPTDSTPTWSSAIRLSQSFDLDHVGHRSSSSMPVQTGGARTRVTSKVKLPAPQQSDGTSDSADQCLETQQSDAQAGEHEDDDDPSRKLPARTCGVRDESDHGQGHDRGGVQQSHGQHEATDPPAQVFDLFGDAGRRTIRSRSTS